MAPPTPSPSAPFAASASYGTVSALKSLIHIPREWFDRVWDSAFYPANLLPLAASKQGANIAVQINASSNFVFVGGTYLVTASPEDGTSQDKPPIEILISLTGQQQVTRAVAGNQGFVPIEALFGSPSLDRQFPVAQPVVKNSTITLTLNNLFTNALNVRIGLFGFHVS